MEQELPSTAQTSSSKTVPIVVISSLTAALIAGGSVYAYQKNLSDKTQADLQSQITSLQQAHTAKPIAINATPAATVTPSATVSPTSSPVAATPALTASQLMNFTYNDLNGKSHVFKNGTTTYSALGGGTGTMTILQDIGVQQIDLNRDGAIDSVLIIGENDGGTGYYYQLVSVLNVNGKPVLSGQHRILDDRATVKNMAISNESIIISGAISGIGQSRADQPNQTKTETYKWVNGTLLAQ